MNRIRPHSLGVACGAFLGLWHMLWSLLVWTGVAQPLLDFVFRLHMLRPPWQVSEFNFGLASALVLVTTAGGYVAGWVAGFLWNRTRPTT